MTFLAAGLGAGVAFFLTAASALSQTLPHAGAEAIDQTTPDSTLLPATGLSLDAPSGLDQPSAGDNEGQTRPSDGLGLQIYESGSARPSADDNREESPRVSPYRLP